MSRIWSSGREATKCRHAGCFGAWRFLITKADDWCRLTRRGSDHGKQDSSGLGSFNASFDSRSYAGVVAGTGAASFAGAFAGGGNVGTLAGVFNSAPGAVAGSPPAGQSGTFGITGPHYLASGVFAGSRN